MAQSRNIDPVRVEFGTSLFALATALGFDLDDAVISVYWHALKDAPPEFRTRAINDAAKRRWFKFPKPADLMEIVNEFIKQRQADVRIELMKSCPHITGGWREVVVNGVERMERCECWTAGKEAADRIGAQLELPPMPQDDGLWS